MEKPSKEHSRLRRIMISALPSALLIAGIFVLSFFKRDTPEAYIQTFEKTLNAFEKEASSELDLLSSKYLTNTPAQIFNEKEKDYDELYAKKGIVYLIYERDSLIFWSDHSPAVENYLKEICLDNRTVKLRNGWYEVIRHPLNSGRSRQFLALILLKNEFHYQNKYLGNNFPDWYKLPGGTDLRELGSTNKNIINSGDGTPLFELEIDLNQLPFSPVDIAILSLYAALLFLLVSFIRKEVFLATEVMSSNNLFFVFALSIIALRFVMLLDDFPGLLYRTPLYDAAVFGNADSFWFGYMGDIIINSGLILYLSLVFLKRFEIKKTHYRNYILLISLGMIFLVLFSTQINAIIVSLVQNSSISFRISDLFSLSLNSYLGFTAVGVLFLSFYIFTDKLVSQVLLFPIHKGILAGLTGLGFILSLVLTWIQHSPDWVQFSWPFAIILLTYFLKIRKSPYSFSYGLAFIICFSTVSTHLFLREEKQKEIGTRKVYADRLSNQQDDVAENLFVDISKKIHQDDRLKTMVFSPPVNSLDLEQRIRQVYLSGYWERFDILISVVDSACVPLIKTVNPIHSNNSYFDQQIEYKGIPTVCKDLYFIENQKGKTRYIAKIKIDAPKGINRKSAVLYVEMEPKLIPDVIGFPELLLDKSVKTNNQLSDYSWAVYKDNELITRSGKYAYNYNYIWPATINYDFKEMPENGYDHLIYTSDETKVVLSMQQSNLKSGFTTNSYFFAFFSLMQLLFLFVREMVARRKLMSTSLNARIQLLLVVVVLISLMAFGIGTFVFVRNQFETQNVETLNQRTKSVLVELQNKFGELDGLNDNYKEYTGYTLQKLSNVFLTDITLYDLKGNLFASSQPRLFDEGIVSSKMNPRAFRNVVSTAITDLVLKENVGKLKFYSSYQPFYNKQRKLMAYLNLPYFAKQSEQEKEISLYITALINIYVILFAISTIAALIISNLVTKPLRIIQQRFSKIRFGRANEPIEWKERDEIGSLVNEYNKMIRELEVSAEKLAKSERESAWREMAKQVAHEIKNPLTPMKLSIQHLQRTITSETNPEELQEKVKKLSAMLIEQIETLSNIASEFSAFAKMPKAVIEEISIGELLNGCAQLFKETENADIIFDSSESQKITVLADKDQCNRVFTNLIKNAVQAIPQDRRGKIEISVQERKKEVIVSVKDNGTGISSEVMDKIFVPNFSTKTEGMGLGLAMVKNIVESFGGKIWFETTLHVGTTFHVSLPLANGSAA